VTEKGKLYRSSKEQKMRGRTEMDRDMAGKQTEAYEQMMIDDRQGDTRESGPALS